MNDDKFRAWVKPDSLINHPSGVLAAAEPNFINDGSRLSNCVRVYRNDLKEKDNFDEILDSEQVELIACTGKIDKNGITIFENDLVHFKCNGLSGFGIVFYDEETAAFKIEDVRYRTKGRIYPFYGDAIYRIDGNKFENQELLDD